MTDEQRKQCVEAIRADKLVGRGTCSTIDEAYATSELIDALEDAGIRSVRGAVRSLACC
jgi:hypothetical protein